MKKRSDYRDNTVFVLLLVSILHIAAQNNSEDLVITGNETVIEGKQVVLKCLYTVGSVVSYTWQKDGGALPVGVNVSTSSLLTVAYADHLKHTGAYTCMVELQNGTLLKSEPFNLTVQYFNGHLSICEVTIDGVSDTPQKPVYDANTDVSFKCCYTNALPSPVISWIKITDNQVNSSTNLLTINSLEYANSGEYECRASHPAGNQTHRIYLSVPFTGPISDDNYKDVVISTPMSKVCTEIGGVANLPFEVSGDFNKISWIFKHFNSDNYVNDKYSFHSDKLVIYNVTTSDVGSYRFSVSGRNGDTEFAQVDLDNNCIESTNIEQSLSGDIHIGMGNTLSLTCNAETDNALPEGPDYTWIIPKETNLTGATITLTNINYDNDGMYKCTADNEFSDPKSRQVRVIVTGPLSIDVTPVSPFGRLNHTLNITCSTNTTQTWFVWKNGTEPVISNSKVTYTMSPDGMSNILSINNLTKYDNVTYTCVVHSNIHLPVTKTVSVSLSTDIYLLWDVSYPAGINQNILSVVCPVTGGHGDLTTTWLRNNTPIPSTDTGITTSINDAGLPELSIQSLDLLHEYDTFTCVTEDAMSGQSFNKSFQVVVEIPAVFKNSGTDTETIVDAIVGDMVNLECKVMGKPMPDIIWIPTDGQTLQQNRYDNYTNGSFIIRHIRSEDEGTYLCYFRWKEMRNIQSKFYTLRVSSRQVTGPDPNGGNTTESTLLGLEQNVFIAIIVAAVGGIFLLLSLVLCCGLICRYCCCQRQNDSEIPRIALETTSFERKPSLRGSYRFKDNSGILGKNASNPSGMLTFHSNKNNPNLIPMTTASSVAVSPGPPIPSPVPTPAGPTTSMVTAPEFQLPNNVTNFPRQNLKLDNVMGEGEFGPVFKGVARNLIKDEPQSLVAVKVLIPREGDENLWPSLMEFANQMKLSSPFIASILGICSDIEPYYVIYDYMDRGDLKRFLLDSRPSLNGQPPSLTQSELLHIVTQVSKGMLYLYKQQIIHGDLATRNCLIGSDLSVKIADLGIGHDLYPSDYHDNGTQLLPIRWMAPELFTNDTEGPSFSLASDVWSFGVFCWEVFAYARSPYDELSDVQVLRLIPEGHVLGAPEEGCPPLLFSLMQDCWAPTIEQRPIFTNITSGVLSIDVD